MMRFAMLSAFSGGYRNAVRTFLSGLYSHEHLRGRADEIFVAAPCQVDGRE
jgi:hypothetical protein